MDDNPNCLTLIIETCTNRVMNVSLNPAMTICKDGHRALILDQAKWLYIALTGHAYDEFPGQASCMYANIARAHILKNAHLNPGWNLAREVVNQWGSHIRPWLGAFLYEKDTGKLIEDAPEYYTLLDLWTGERISPAEQMTVIQR